ncbi:MAG: rRNA pseudouridine synthase [Coriobacteriales bacterium]|nr:rRNA pseudouridine synthase [Coriobacteriales bacterium]
MRLQKFLARAGAASRRGSEELMSAGRVTVNGCVVTELGSKVDPLHDVICLDGRPLRLGDDSVCLMLNKPAGYLTTMDDPQGRPTVRELIPAVEHPGLFPVGRLDFDTTGLLLFMTDGELAHRLLHPSHHVSKRYRAVVAGRLSEAEAEQLRQGVLLKDGPTQPAGVEIGESSARALSPRARHTLPAAAAEQTTVWCTIREGRKRQVRRMFAHIGHEVLELEREAFGPLQLGGLPSGQWRYLEQAEIQALHQAAG